MSDVTNTVESGKTLLQAYIQAKAGNTKKAKDLFVEAVGMEEFDVLADGLAKSLSELEASSEEEDDDGDELEASADDGEDVQVPASVANVLDLEY